MEKSNFALRVAMTALRECALAVSPASPLTQLQLLASSADQTVSPAIQQILFLVRAVLLGPSFRELFALHATLPVFHALRAQINAISVLRVSITMVLSVPSVEKTVKLVLTPTLALCATKAL